MGSFACALVVRFDVMVWDRKRKDKKGSFLLGSRRYIIGMCLGQDEETYRRSLVEPCGIDISVAFTQDADDFVIESWNATQCFLKDWNTAIAILRRGMCMEHRKRRPKVYVARRARRADHCINDTIPCADRK